MNAFLRMAVAAATGIAALSVTDVAAQQRQQQQPQAQQQQQQQQQRQQPQAQQQQQRSAPRDVSQTPTGKILQDTATGRQSPERTFDGRRDNPPVHAGQPKPTTPEQRIQQYRDSGQPAGRQTLQTNPVPPPSTKK